MKQLKVLLALVVLFATGFAPFSIPADYPDPTPPPEPVKLIFIHHSTGGNWLADPASNELGGGLGQALMENNYYVSATNYGWGPDAIGDATDIPNWLDWFRGDRSPVYLDALYHESGQNAGDFGDWQRLPQDPGGENLVIMFKSCFPNSNLEGKPDDPPDPDGWLSVGHAKYVYNELLDYFITRPDKLFVVVTAPPLSASSTSPGASANARAFNLWLVNDWLAENDYPLDNVVIFDFYNILTGETHHHRMIDGRIEHTYTVGQDTLVYPSWDDHPSQAGNQKATAEFISMLNAWYNRWNSGTDQTVESEQNIPETAVTTAPQEEETPLTPPQATPEIIEAVDQAAARFIGSRTLLWVGLFSVVVFFILAIVMVVVLSQRRKGPRQ